MSTPGEDRNRRLRFLDALEAASRDDPPAPISEEQLAHDTAEILARVRRTMAERARERPVSVLPAPPRRPVAWLPLVALAVLTLAVGVFPGQGVVSVLLFLVAPAALVLKWAFEAYAGPELERECAVLDERARRFRSLRRRVDGAADGVADAREGHPSRDQLDEAATRLRSAAATLEVLADLVARTSTTSRAFAANWHDVGSFSTHRNDTADIAPDRVRLTLIAALGQLRGLASMHIDVPSPADAFGGGRTVGAEIEAIEHEVARSQTTLERELRRLERAFETVHHTAAEHVIKNHIPARLVRSAALIGMNVNVSTLSRARRTPARAVFVREMGTPDQISLRQVRHATAAMRTAA